MMFELVFRWISFVVEIVEGDRVISSGIMAMRNRNCLLVLLVSLADQFRTYNLVVKLVVLLPLLRGCQYRRICFL